MANSWHGENTSQHWNHHGASETAVVKDGTPQFFGYVEPKAEKPKAVKPAK